MAEVQQSLAQRVTLEREKRLKLKAAARAKLQKVEEGQGGLRQELGSLTREIDKWKAKLKEQLDKQKAAEADLAQTLKKAQESEARAQKSQVEKANMQRELLEMQRLHEKLVTELELTGSRLQDINARQREERELWQARQLEKIDNRLDQQRRLDHE